jgi:ABC-type multidrug transport system fused ATPase/permease subunit
MSLDRKIVLLDDCLSAVDVSTEKELVTDLLMGQWKNKTRLLVTHRLSVLPQCDVVWRLEAGRLAVEVSE